MTGSAREVSLAALTVLDAGPVRQIEAAAAAGFDAVGLRLKPLLATDFVTIGDARAEHAVRAALDATGLGVLEIGVVTITEDLDASGLLPLLDFSAEIGARFLVCPVADADAARRRDTLSALAAETRPRGLVPLIEFNPYSACTNLAEALALAAEVGAPDVGLCIDAFHLSRSGGAPADVEEVPPEFLRLLHLADAAPEPPGARSVDEIRSESRGARLLPGEGSLWLGDLLAVLPADIPVSVEAPSATLAGFAPEKRARRAFDATRRLLATTG